MNKEEKRLLSVRQRGHLVVQLRKGHLGALVSRLGTRRVDDRGRWPRCVDGRVKLPFVISSPIRSGTPGSSGYECGHPGFRPFCR